MVQQLLGELFPDAPLSLAKHSARELDDAIQDLRAKLTPDYLEPQLHQATVQPYVTKETR